MQVKVCGFLFFISFSGSQIKFEEYNLVLQVGDVEKSPQALCFERLNLFVRVSEQGPSFTAIQEDGGDKRLVELEPASEADGVAQPGPV